jgi:hypothetical protein
MCVRLAVFAETLRGFAKGCMAPGSIPLKLLLKLLLLTGFTGSLVRIKLGLRAVCDWFEKPVNEALSLGLAWLQHAAGASQ